MPKKKKELTVWERESIVAHVLVVCDGLILTHAAIKSVGLKSPQKNETRKKRVYMQAQKIKVVGNNTSITSTCWRKRSTVVL